MNLNLGALQYPIFETFQSRLNSVVWTLNSDRDESASTFNPCQPGL